MILMIDTAAADEIIIALKDSAGMIVRKKVFKADRQQAEKLLPAIDKMLAEAGLKIKKLSQIQVVKTGDSFTSLRIGVLTANALAYALGIEIEAVDQTGQPLALSDRKEFFGRHLIVPDYKREPNIGISKKKLLL